MKYLSKICFLLCFVLNVSARDKVEEYVQHVKRSIDKANCFESKLSDEILNMEGMSGFKVRHLLNNICELPNANYFEIGTWKGSTLISSLYQNETMLNRKTACDSWEYDAKRDFVNNISTFLPDSSFDLIEVDCFQIPHSTFSTDKVNIYFYDGGHTYEDHYKAFTYFNDIFDDVFIVIVDDFRWDDVANATMAAFKDLEYTIAYSKYLAPELENPEYIKNDAFDGFGWWNGIYVAVVVKNQRKE